MEVVLGFAVGYWVGTRQGREGMYKAMDSARAIWESPETKRMLSEGLSALDRARKGRGDARVSMIRGVVDDLIERRKAA
jgi:hypothetical protein